mmetsp:Transcript_32891/g.50313  ORF Transcript_32891/g.50313 Transcript_32891/m.50313 type:complete len:156 (-) Transcript_32891:202-669(-)
MKTTMKMNRLASTKEIARWLDEMDVPDDCFFLGPPVPSRNNDYSRPLLRPRPNNFDYDGNYVRRILHPMINPLDDNAREPVTTSTRELGFESPKRSSKSLGRSHAELNADPQLITPKTQIQKRSLERCLENLFIPIPEDKTPKDRSPEGSKRKRT